jgi:hypothetical protein
MSMVERLDLELHHFDVKTILLDGELTKMVQS